MPADDRTIPPAKADARGEGGDVTVAALAWLVHEVLAAERILVAVVDLRPSSNITRSVPIQRSWNLQDTAVASRLHGILCYD